MKKIFTLFTLMLLVTFAMAQTRSQRVAIIEEFTQASCSYCADFNPDFNALLHLGTNVPKIIPIKYQVWWPGYDPMYFQNPVDVQVRTAYYNPSGAPEAVLDGDVWQDSPSVFTQTMIDDEAAVYSPFTMSLTHTINAAMDSVFITCIITADTAITGPLVAHVALVEKVINFVTAPGNNGEKDFYEVMKKMYPNAYGSLLSNSWAAGDVDTLTFAEAIPNWYYDLRQLEVVAFVQDTLTKNIKQGVLSEPITLSGDVTLDASITAITVPALSCSLPIALTCTLKNVKATVLTSATINCQIDNGAITTQAWTGSLAAGATAAVTLPDITSLTGGSHRVNIWVSYPNGISEYYPNNNAKNKAFTYSGSVATVPLTEDFQGTTFPSPDWFIVNPDDGQTWQKLEGYGGFGQSNSCTFINLYNYTTVNQLDYLHIPAVDLSAISAAALTFNHAYCSYAGEADGLKVEVSVNCGATWTVIYNKSGVALATGPNSTGNWAPSATQWAWDNVDLTQFAGETSVFIRFTSVNKYGNNLFLDDINVTTAVGIDNPVLQENAIAVYPNPFSTTTTVDLNLNQTSAVDVKLVNMIGQTVYSENYGLLGAGKNSITLDAQNLPAGMYYLHLNVDGRDYTRKVAVEK